MPRLQLDLSEAQSLKPIPEGIYPMVVEEFSEVREGPKAKYIEARLEISEGDYSGRTFYQNLPIHGKGAGIFVDFINKCSGSEFDIDDLAELDIDTDDYVGAEVGGVVKDEEYPEGSGDFRSKIQRIVSAK